MQTEAANRKRAETMRKRWASLSPQERSIIAYRQSIAAKRMWRARSLAERKRIGQLISQGKKGAKGDLSEGD